MMKHQELWRRAAFGALMFAAGFVAHAWLQPSMSHAENKFGPGDVQSVPESFLSGGDRNFTVLREIHTVLANQQGILQEIAANTESTASQLSSVSR